MKHFRFILICAVFIFFSGTVSILHAEETVTVANWNVQTFFNAEKNGCEYKDFCLPAVWSHKEYEARLDRLCGAIKKIDADIFVMEEIEEQGIIYDISNRLAGGSWNPRKNWNYACFAKTPGDAIGCAVLSRFPLSEMSVHALDIRTENECQPAMRPMIQISVSVGKESLILLVNHWKSKSGGQEISEKWRDWQESVLRRIILRLSENQKTAVIACGDFNRDINEFCREPAAAAGRANIVLRSKWPSGQCDGADTEAAVYSPWFSPDGTLITPGSYFYKGKWERIDHFFSAGTASITDFAPEVTGEWAGEGYVPCRYQIHTGTGWSDHLPIKCRVMF